MKILIDTHIFLWMCFDVEKLSEKQKNILENLENEIFLSSISIAEISIKQSIKKLNIKLDIEKAINEMEIKILDFNLKSAIILKNLPLYHKDPFDRMIISQSLAYNIPIMTNDNKFNLYKINLIKE